MKPQRIQSHHMNDSSLYNCSTTSSLPAAVGDAAAERVFEAPALDVNVSAYSLTDRDMALSTLIEPHFTANTYRNMPVQAGSRQASIYQAARLDRRTCRLEAGPRTSPPASSYMSRVWTPRQARATREPVVAHGEAAGEILDLTLPTSQCSSADPAHLDRAAPRRKALDRPHFRERRPGYRDSTPLICPGAIGISFPLVKDKERTSGVFGLSSSSNLLLNDSFTLAYV
ncbi:uncharacterized protein PHACADRAFT_183059 [Phanerochaete carnosa HHB-10118-sp]|uniref:Uncharacterized protein n=1 Tax=Phanerochaete carnosa (strain HHB-10118-sp) TaxID=650164 RepID=K5X0S4_PHACS|nr:uncharacterized protein PHACADRAFT_183059 [Phanerochaete carnosa HHB-10118-sp]EKM56347.1 hypothetical protein PHACADRAFT_183059 [Phanerochaete carnosa HHB-10118-sp]